MYAGIGVVGDRQVRQQARELEPGQLSCRERAADRERVRSRQPPATHAGVDLHVHLAAESARDQPLARVRRRDADLETLRLRRTPGLERAEQEDRNRRPEGGAQRLTLVERRDADPGRSAGERRPRAALGPVPVAVGLDDGPELRPAEHAPTAVSRLR